MPHTCRSHCPSGSAQLGGFRTFAEAMVNVKVAPKAAMCIRALELTRSSRGSGDRVPARFGPSFGSALFFRVSRDVGIWRSADRRCDTRTAICSPQR
jgi:hypothetical protein